MNKPGVWLLWAGLAALPCGTRAQTTEGPYGVAAVGATRYGFDCYFFSCNGGHATAVKALLGYRRGDWSVEGSWANFGRSSTASSIASLPNETLRLQGLGVGLTAYRRWGPQLEVAGRLGWAQVRHERSREASASQGSPTFGLGMLWETAPALAVEFAWDYVSAEGRASGTASANAFTVGLRAHF